MELLLMVLLWWLRCKVLVFMSRLLLAQKELLEDFLFYSSYSLDPLLHELQLKRWCYRLYQAVQSLLFSSFLLRMLGLSRQIMVLVVVFLLLLGVAHLLSTLQKAKSRLIEECSSFVFYYEVFLMQGENQLQALLLATPHWSLLYPKDSVPAYVVQFHRLFYHTKWLVIKRVMILLEKGMHFTQKDMTMEFAQISDELFNRHYQDKKLQAEKLENLMLLPMIGDLVIMVIYLMSPFLGDILGG